ncbi:MAG: 30S ribosomal protein S17 [Nitrospinota bacterium]
MRRRRLLALAALLTLLLSCLPLWGEVLPLSPLAQAFREGRSGLFLEAEGEVVKILRDDLKGRRHQRFIIRTQENQTVLISHNISLSPRVPVRVGDRVRIIESRPLSRTKRWRFLEVVEKAR